MSGYLAGPAYIADLFDSIGYRHEYATAEQVAGNALFYRKKMTAYIDRGIPVLVQTNLHDIPEWVSDVGTYCLAIGYEDDGRIAKLLVSDKTTIDYAIDDHNRLNFIFCWFQAKEVSLEELYLQILKKMPCWLTLPERDGMYFGAAAYRKWADDIESGRFCDDSLDLWGITAFMFVTLQQTAASPRIFSQNWRN